MAKLSRAKRVALKIQGKGKAMRLAKCTPGLRMIDFPVNSAGSESEPDSSRPITAIPPTLPTGVAPADAESEEEEEEEEEPSSIPEPPRSGERLICPLATSSAEPSRWWDGRLAVTPPGLPVRFDYYLADVSNDVFRMLMESGPIDVIPTLPDDPAAIDMERAIRADDTRLLDASLSVLIRMGVVRWKELMAVGSCETIVDFWVRVARWGAAALSVVRFLGETAPMPLWDGDNVPTLYGTLVWRRFARRITDRATVLAILNKGSRGALKRAA